ETGSRRSPDALSMFNPSTVEVSLPGRSRTRTSSPSWSSRRSRLAPRCPLAPVSRIMCRLLSLALEIYRLKLVSEARACLQGLFEVGLAQGKQLDIVAGGQASGVTRLVNNERAFTEEISRIQRRKMPFLADADA